MLVAIYARVSTRDKGQDVENQLSQLRSFAEKNGWTIFQVYCDEETGSTSERVQFKAMFAAASRREFDLILFWALDRFTREGVLETLQHLNRLTSYGVGYKSFTEQYLDSCGIFKDVVIAIMATIAKQERVRLSERVRAGLVTARAKGKRIGRPSVGLDDDLIAQRRREGKPWRAIAREFGVGTPTVMRAALRSNVRHKSV